MGNNLYFISGDSAVILNCTKYKHEEDLQALIAANPNLVARSSADGELFLISKELKMLEDSSGANAFYLDLLLADSSGIPVLVEVKRSTDTRIKREVVGQLFDYACRAAEWDIQALQNEFAKNHPNEELSLMDDYWGTIEANLKSSSMRLVFAADEIPESLAKIITFLDAAMPNIEVYGVELPQYINSGIQLISTHVVNERAIQTPSPSANELKEWTDQTFFLHLQEHGLDAAIPVFEKLRAFATESLQLTAVVGHGPRRPTFMFKDSKRTIFCVEAWAKKPIGNICAIEFCIRNLTLYAQGSGWAEEIMRRRFSHFPHPEAYDPKLLWHTKENLYVDLRVLEDKDNFECLIAALRDYCETLKALAVGITMVRDKG